MAQERRKNPLIEGDEVIIAPERFDRPFAFINSRSSLSSDDPCPFCRGNENYTTPETLAYRFSGSNQNDPRWWIRFVKNKYSAVSDAKNDAKSDRLLCASDALGIHEVGITCEHGADFGEQGFDEKHNLTYEVLWAIHQRKVALMNKHPNFLFAEFFKNRGKEAGGSLDHPHIQLIATDVIPFRNRLEYLTSSKYNLENNRCLFCDLMKQEQETGDRIVEKNNDFIVLAPFASRVPYETWIVPANHEEGYTITREKALSLSGILRNTFSRLNHLLKNPDYNFSLQDAPLNLGNGGKNYHWYIELSPRLTKSGGWERGTWVYINPISPEKAAEEMRKAPTS
ncbi:MAG: DUF4921 family protein [Nanoarchaeota archaeon]|nr:DUF4921 family protein [Nanoarchaeota archaeon]